MACTRSSTRSRSRRWSRSPPALDAAGVPLIEVTHGDGLGGASVNYGFPAHSDEEYLRAVIPQLKRAKVSALLLPGIGTVEHLKLAHDCGVATIRVATHCTEADVSEQHIAQARKLGLDTVGFLMMAHMVEPEELARQGQPHGKLRRQLHLLHRFGRLHAPRRRERAHPGAARGAAARAPRSAFTATTTWPWASPTRSRPSRPARCASTAPRPAWAPAPATPRSRSSTRWPSAWGSTPASMSSG